MRNADSCRRIINPYARIVWITNPDDAADNVFSLMKL